MYKKIAYWVAAMLPRRVTEEAFLRVANYANCVVYLARTPDEISIREAHRAWHT